VPWQQHTLAVPVGHPAGKPNSRRPTVHQRVNSLGNESDLSSCQHAQQHIFIRGRPGVSSQLTSQPSWPCYGLTKTQLRKKASKLSRPTPVIVSFSCCLSRTSLAQICGGTQNVLLISSNGKTSFTEIEHGRAGKHARSRPRREASSESVASLRSRNSSRKAASLASRVYDGNCPLPCPCMLHAVTGAGACHR
jgi:hypothetical protein